MRFRELSFVIVIGVTLLFCQNVVYATWESDPNWVSYDEVFTTCIATGLVDDNDYPDIIAGNYSYPYGWTTNNLSALQLSEIGGSIVGYRNTTGTPSSQSPTTFISGLCVRDLALADYDDDGDLDLAVGLLVGEGGDGGVKTYTNDDQVNWDVGLFDVDFESDDSYDCACVRWVDFDLDGDLDLAALEVGGILHLYRYEPTEQAVWAAYQEPLDLTAPLRWTDDLEGVADYHLGGTTMEFGDIDDNGTPDLFLNLPEPKGQTTGGYLSAPVILIWQRTWPHYTLDEVYTDVKTQDRGKESIAVARFGKWPGTDLALAVAGNSHYHNIDEDTESLYIEKQMPDADVRGVSIYTFDDDELDEEWTSEFDLHNEYDWPQYYTGIMWGNINSGGRRDLVLCSYPCAAEIGGSPDWVRGREQLFLDPTESTTDLPDWYSNSPDLSTSMALTDLDNGDTQSHTQALDDNGGDIKSWTHLDDQPVGGIDSVRLSNNDKSSWIKLDSTDFCCDLERGWVSVIEDSLDDATDLEIYYWTYDELDLIVGNDGENAAYYYDGGDNPEFSAKDLTAQSYLDNHAYTDTISADQNFMDDDSPIGITVGLPTVDEAEVLLEDHDNIKLVGVSAGWSAITPFQGLYYWNKSDQILDLAYSMVPQNPSDIKPFIMGHHTPLWTMGDYDPEDANDVKKRTCDERLHTHYVRAVVNRYRPDGVCASSDEYNWDSDDWGVTIFQFENEPDNDDWGYGWIGYPTTSAPSSSDVIVTATAEKMYREYQMIKGIQEELQSPPSSNYPDLKVVSPNWGNFAGNSTHYAGPWLPYLNALNEVTLWSTYTDILEKYCDYVCQQAYCTLPSGGNWYNPKDPFGSDYWSKVNDDEDLRAGFENVFWGYYTTGLNTYYNYSPYSTWDWDPVLSGCEHPFFVMEFGYNDDQMHYAASHFAELFSIDVYPNDENTEMQLVQYCAPMDSKWSEDPRARLVDTMSKLLAGTECTDYTWPSEPYEPTNDNELFEIIYQDETTNDYVDVLRTYDAPKTSATAYELQGSLGSSDRVAVYDISGAYMDRGVDGSSDIGFAAYELNQTQVLIVDEDAFTGDYNQGVQLERGWNLVSWYAYPVGTGGDIDMDDVFGSASWFDSDAGDEVGVYNQDPLNLYPEFENSEDWEWEMEAAYPVHMESAGHFWEITNQPDFSEGSFNFTPSIEWDDNEDLGLGQPSGPDYWYFIGYPLRKQIMTSASSTLADLWDRTSIGVVKDDAGNWYVEGQGTSTLKYLKPGKGYYLGFSTSSQVTNCEGFSDEGNQPESTKPDPLEEQKDTSSEICAHFQFESRTHWWYPIMVDTIVVDEVSPEIGDEIAVFDGVLCVGAKVFDGEYPIFMAAWKDDIATPDIIDGYQVDNDITFVWYDVSENEEITFTPPPTTMAAQPEEDPHRPTHSGFGVGLYARRSLSHGILSVNSLPKEYKIRQNYPNPFNAETIIPMELPQRSRIRIDLYNVLGQHLGEVFEGVKNAGLAEIRYNAEHLSSGMYIYTIEAEGLERDGKFTSAGKMLLLK